MVAGDGAIWFTDPSYGHLQGFRPPPEVGDFVYRYDPATGELTVVADGFDKPNGLAFSPPAMCSTSPTAAPTRRPARSTPAAPITSRRST